MATQIRVGRPRRASEPRCDHGLFRQRIIAPPSPGACETSAQRVAQRARFLVREWFVGPPTHQATVGNLDAAPGAR
eukprot:13482170-Alexandrium_andersonii.AAC.1